MNAVASSRRFAPGWPTTLFVVFFLPLLLGLGSWQMQRAEEKRELQSLIDLGQAQLPTSLRSVQAEPSMHWRPVRLQGSFDAERVWLLDNRTRGGQAGVEVLQLFSDQSGQELVVNRGWVAWPDRSSLPTISTPAGPLVLDAEIVPPAGTAFTLGEAQTQAGWPKLIVALDVQSMSIEAGVDLPPWTARLRTGSSQALRLEWPPLPTSASRHIGYAVQWFALAAALLILYIWAGFRPDRDREPTQ